MLIPKEKRKRFNAIRSFSSSGAIIVGPAIGGFLVLLTSVETTLLLNPIFFLIPSILLLFLPEKETIDKKTIPPLSVSQVIHDFTIVWVFLLTIFSKSLSLRYMLSIGLFMVTVGYMIYAFSWSFTSVSIGFIILGFFNAFLNAGSMTFFQNNFPVNVMGRVTSIFQLIQSVGQITFILSIGII